MLAITLTSSLLQLYMTPWLSEYWGKKDIAFVRSPSDAKRPVDIEQPFVIAKFGVPYEEQKLMKPSETEAKSSLLALAVILLELYVGQPVERQHRAEDSSYFFTVRRWADQQRENLSQAVFGALCRCISWYADPSKELSNAEFRQEILSQLVIPLRDELETFISP